MNLINVLKKGFISTIKSFIILSLLIILNPYSYSQTEQDEFLIGGYCASMHDPYQDSIYVMNYNQILECGLNSVWQKVKWTSPKRNLELLSPFKFIYAANDTAPQHTPIEGNKDWISYFTHAKYFRWEAEGDNNFPYDPGENRIKVGVKHNFIGNATTDGWSSGTNASDIGKYFIDGPDYTQYKRHVYTNRQLNNPAIQYNAVFSLKLGSPQSGSFDVAKILVTVYNTETHQETELPNSRIIKSDQLSSTAYTNFTITYDYSTFLESIPNNNNYPPPPSAANWTPLMESDATPWLDFSKKVRFKVQKLSTAEVIVDYIEVYDREIWETYFIIQPQLLVSKITNYVQQFSDLGDKLKYYGTIDEPHTWDSFIPIKRIQEILDEHCAGKELLVHFYPEWNNRKEGVTLLDKWVNIAQPKKLMFWYFPFSCWNGTTEYCDPNPVEKTLYDLRNDLQKSHLLKPQFFVTLQSSGIYDSITQDYWKYYRPTPAGISAETMISLAHGTLGIFYEPYYSYKSGDRKVEALVDYPENNFEITDNWLKVQSLASRLKGTLGQTLLKLNYIATEDNNGYLRLARGLDSWAPETPTTDSLYYLTLSTTTQNPTPSSYNFHTGFFNRVGQPENNYFLLTNLLTTESRWVSITITNNFSNCSNIRFRNIEPSYSFDMIFTGQTTQSFNFPAGEGYLFQVAPVVKYGGKLVYNETVANGTTLYEDMTIENGATLTVNGTYNAKANITVKSGGKIIAGTNSKIIFDTGKKLIINGIAEVKGTSILNRLNLQYNGPDNGVVIKPGSSLTMNYCNVTGAYQGIVTESGDQSYVNISNSIISAGYSGISLVASTTFEGFQTPPTPTIQNCNITAGISGISVSNYSSVLLKSNTFTNCGITVSNVASAYIQSNNISLGTNTYNPGIFFNNSGGYIRSNTIKNRVNGIHISNSSPDCGGNLIENNFKHGLYIAGSSIPNLIGFVQTNPPTYYPLAGYNTIRNNGNNTQSNTENDGSEIYFSYSDAQLGTLSNPGCNQISDDRTATPSMTTIWLLSGVYGNEPHFLDAIYNYWGTTVPTSSRFGIATNFSPFYSSMCSPNGGGEEEKLVLKTSSGEVVDSISSAEGVPENFTTLEAGYSEADNYFATGNVTQAKPLYEQIVTGNYTSEEKLSAYNKLYAIGNLTGEDEIYFTSLQTTFEDIANNEADTLIKKVYEQNAIKCDVSKEEYLTAISKFDNIIQQNPNSEEAVYAEIDILTTALNLDTTNTQLGKMGGGKYLVKGTSDYLSKLNDILQSKFGVNSEEGKQIIPKEYSLHQNYPNPFNPTTTIKFDIPKDGLITLEVYDILGRRIAKLIDEYKPAGSYEQVFNASYLASGVYVYKLQAGDFVSSKKMMLLK